MTRSSAPTGSARRCPSSADEGRKPTSGRESIALGGDGRVCIDRRDHQAPCRDMDAKRLGVTPLSFDLVLETRSSESPRARPRVVASGSHGTVICDHHERAGGCVGGVVLHEQRLATRSAALGARGGWCLSTPTILADYASARRPSTSCTRARAMSSLTSRKRQHRARAKTVPRGGVVNARRPGHRPGRSAAQSIDDGEHGIRLRGAMLV